MADHVLAWRTSSYTTNGACVQVAARADDLVAVRNSNRPDAGTLTFGRAEIGALLAGIKAGDLDDLT